MPTGILQQSLGDILDNYADVIEGGTTWRGSGTSYRGIAGRQSSDPMLRNGAEDDVAASGAGSTTEVVCVGVWASDRWKKTDVPGYFLECTGATNTQNIYAARRITDWTQATTRFTVDAFPAATSAGDTFKVRQGFKRLPNQLDINSDEPLVGAANGFDRFFQLRMLPGKQLEYFGDGLVTYEATLELYLRFLKFGREHDAIASALENLAIIRPILCRGSGPDHRDGTYTRGLIPLDNAAEVFREDKQKIVMRDRYRIYYRIDTTYN